MKDTHSERYKANARNQALARAIRAVRQIAKTGDRADLDSYLASPQFAEAMRVMGPGKVMAFTAELQAARQAVEVRFPPLPPGKHRANWKDPAQVERLRKAWHRHRGNIYRVARELRITENAVEAAFNRFLRDDATRAAAGNLAPVAKDGRSASPVPGEGRTEDANGRGKLAA